MHARSAGGLVRCIQCRNAGKPKPYMPQVGAHLQAKCLIVLCQGVAHKAREPSSHNEAKVGQNACKPAQQTFWSTSLEMRPLRLSCKSKQEKMCVDREDVHAGSVCATL